MNSCRGATTLARRSGLRAGRTPQTGETVILNLAGFQRARACCARRASIPQPAGEHRFARGNAFHSPVDPGGRDRDRQTATRRMRPHTPRAATAVPPGQPPPELLGQRREEVRIGDPPYDQSGRADDPCQPGKVVRGRVARPAPAVGTEQRRHPRVAIPGRYRHRPAGRRRAGGAGARRNRSRDRTDPARTAGRRALPCTSGPTCRERASRRASSLGSRPTTHPRRPSARAVPPSVRCRSRRRARDGDGPPGRPGRASVRRAATSRATTNDGPRRRPVGRNRRGRRSSARSRRGLPWQPGTPGHAPHGTESDRPGQDGDGNGCRSVKRQTKASAAQARSVDHRGSKSIVTTPRRPRRLQPTTAPTPSTITTATRRPGTRTTRRPPEPRRGRPGTEPPRPVAHRPPVDRPQGPPARTSRRGARGVVER